MAGLRRVIDQGRFRNRAAKVAEKVLGCTDLLTWAESEPDDAYEDDGNLHVVRYGLHVVFGLNQDNGKWSNEKTREILAALGMKKRIGKRTLVEEECEECDGSGYVTCSEHGEHSCSDCGGEGLVEPEDYK